ncbi:MAG: FmdE family protein [Deltaproteobacteria bacterium]|jgi:formylmethanofuran dehydrogenase subunit E|nr:FmdE family protein [Deltaproteobacteria bacterium]
MNKELWDKAMDFHGHACPGLAIGFMASMAVLEDPELGKVPHGDLVCLTENDACGVDAIQSVLGCTLGKGNLILKDVGKHAYSFYDRKSGNSLRLVSRRGRSNPDLDREARIAAVLETPLTELFERKPTSQPAPHRAKIFATVICQECGEPTAEHRLRVKDGKSVCLDCFADYGHRW